MLYLLDRALQQAGLSRLSLQDFVQTDYQLALRLVQEALEQDEQEPRLYIQEHQPEALRELVRELSKAPQDRAEPTDERQVEELVRMVMLLRLNHVTESLNQLRFLQQELQEQGDLRALPYQDLVLQHAQASFRLHRALAQPSIRD